MTKAKRARLTIIAHEQPPPYAVLTDAGSSLGALSIPSVGDELPPAPREPQRGKGFRAVLIDC